MFVLGTIRYQTPASSENPKQSILSINTCISFLTVSATVLHEAEAFVSPTGSFGKLDSRSHVASNGHTVCSAGSAFSPVPRGASVRPMQRAGIVKRRRGGVQRHVLKAQMTDEEMALDQASAVLFVLDVE